MQSPKNVGVVSNKNRKRITTKRPPRSAQPSTARSRMRKKNTKHIGSLAELDFMLEAASRGFPVGRPFGDNEAYDVWVDAGARVWRVQVKTATPYRNQTFGLRSHWSGYKHITPYTPADIDFLAGLVRSPRTWYLIPATAIQRRLMLNLYPFGARRRAGQFEKYREAWHLLKPRSGRASPGGSA